jgi:hypothetical protein
MLRRSDHAGLTAYAAFPMFTSRRIQAFFRKHQAHDRFPANDVGFDNFVDVSLGYVSVPNGVGIDHEIRSVLALVETARLIGAHFTLEAAFGQLLFEKFLQFRLAVWIAASPRVTRRALVTAYKNVPFELGHKIPAIPGSGSTSQCLPCDEETSNVMTSLSQRYPVYLKVDSSCGSPTFIRTLLFVARAR